MACAECSGKGSAYCVELNKVFCRQCVGRLFYPGTKSCEFTLEALDEQHPGVQTLTVAILHISVLAVLATALWKSGIGADYFQGQNTCPALSLPRQALARFDPNLFYYYKPSLSTYCDIEDSFWRLLMDGWLRGVVGGTDSLLLLASTIPKAWLFKKAISTFLGPVYAAFYALCGLFVSMFIARLEDAGGLLARLLGLGGGARGAAGKAKVAKAGGMSWVWLILRTPLSLKNRIMTKNTYLWKAEVWFLASGLSTSVRLLLHWAGLFGWLASHSSTNEVSVWQLAFEPFCYFFIAGKLNALIAKLGKTIWKPGVAVPPAPLTLWRKKPMKDVMELITYSRGRFFRSYGYYERQANAVLYVLIDDTFNFVILFRLLGIMFGLAPVARGLVRRIGFGPILDHHQEWFQQGTGFVDIDAGAKYMSDRIVKFGFHEMFVGFKFIGEVIEAESEEAFSHEGTMWYMAKELVLWRLSIPVFLCYLWFWVWEGFLKKQQATYKREWQGHDWADGEFVDMLDEFGSYWNMVTKDQWETPKQRAARLAAVPKETEDAAAAPAASPRGGSDASPPESSQG